MGSGASSNKHELQEIKAKILEADSEHIDAVLEESVRKMKEDIKAELKRELTTAQSNGNISGAGKNMGEKKLSNVAPSGHLPDAPKLEPITYEEAFEAIGGDKELAKYANVAKELNVDDSELQAELKELLPHDYTKRSGFSTKLINQPYVRDLEDLYSKANDVYPHFDDVVRQLASKTNGEARVPPIKGEVRARMKAIFKYASGDGIAWYRLTDLVRATIVYKDIPALYNGLKEVVTHFGTSVKELNDRYQKPLAGGYRDMQLVILFEGHMCELQLSTEAMVRAKETTGHRDFEVLRELKAAIKEGDFCRVMRALEFGREHLGSTVSGGEMALGNLLRSEEANTLTHDAANRGHAEIVHAFLLHGADANVQDSKGNTPLHYAVFKGHERCVWVLLNEGNADLDKKNNDGQTALVMGYLMLWQRPPEHAVRAVSTLAQMAGVDRIKEARAAVDGELRKLLKPSRQLVDFVADGNVEKMREELRNYADPNSNDREGNSAVVTAIVNGHVDALKVLLDYNASLDASIWSKLPANTHPDMIQILVDEGASLVENVSDPGVGTSNNALWKRGRLQMGVLTEGAKVYTDRKYTWENVPIGLHGAPMICNPCHCVKDLKLKVKAYNETIGVIVPHGASKEYSAEVKAFTERLVALGFSATPIPHMRSGSFKIPGVDLWQLYVNGRKEVTIENTGDMEMNVCLYKDNLKPASHAVEVIGGRWNNGLLKLVALKESVAHYSDRQHKFSGIPSVLFEKDMTLNPCHTQQGLKLKITACDETIGVLVAHGNKNDYAAECKSFTDRLQDLGFTMQTLSDMVTSSFPRHVGVDLWQLQVSGKKEVCIETTGDMELNCVFI